MSQSITVSAILRSISMLCTLISDSMCKSHVKVLFPRDTPRTNLKFKDKSDTLRARWGGGGVLAEHA